MPLNIRSWNVDDPAERLTAKTPSAENAAVEHTLDKSHHVDEKLPFRERLRLIKREIQSWPVTGLDADKTFFDDLSGEG